MPADEPFDQRPFSLLAMLAARYPHWTIWYGQATHHWWAFPSRDPGVGRLVEANTVKELVESIEDIRVHRGATPPLSAPPGGTRLGEGRSRVGRSPATVWNGNGLRRRPR